MTKQDLYHIGVDAACTFLDHNKIAHPVFMTYEEALDDNALGSRKSLIYARNLLRRVASGPTQGTGTGLYSNGYVFVNVPHTAAPVQKPEYRSWSWPGWKTDRTAIGVVAHEVGHYVVEKVSEKYTPEERAEQRAEWLQAIRGRKVSGYEPVPDEAAAESLRLFILNPNLLRCAIPKRYNFICELGLEPLPKLLRKDYKTVLNNTAYNAAADKFARS